MRILKFYAENVLRLQAVPITPTGNVIQITGANASGKSSVLNAIFYALAGKSGHAAEPIRHGTERAIIRLVLGGEGERELVVTRRFSGAGTALTVESSDGAVFKSPQGLLEKMIEGLTFDPVAFSRLTPKQQAETLRGLVTLDTDVEALDAANARDYELRREWNRKVEFYNGRVATLKEGVTADEPSRVDIEALTAQMAQASEHNAAIERTRTDRETRRFSIQEKARRIRTLRDEIERLTKQADGLEAEWNVARNVLDDEESVQKLPEPIDVTALAHEINEAMKVNTLHDNWTRQRELLDTAMADLRAAQIVSSDLSEAMEKREAEKQASIARAKMPIEGLSFTPGEVLYKGVPYAQASAAEQIRVATAIGMTLRPELRILCIRDGSLLDDSSRAIIAQLADEHDFQVWLEAVSPEPTIGFHMVDGRLAAIDGVAQVVEDEKAERDEDHEVEMNADNAPSDEQYRRDMQDAGRGHLVR